MSKTARDVMSGRAQCVQSTETSLDSARRWGARRGNPGGLAVGSPA